MDGYKLSSLAGSILLLVASQTVNAQSALTVADEVDPGFESLGTEEPIRLQQVPPGGGTTTQLENGTPVEAGAFPGVFEVVTGNPCTATLVGPSAMLMAAHCIAGSTLIEFKIGSKSVRGRCESAPGFQGHPKYFSDWALCRLNRRTASITYDTVDIDGPLPAETTRVKMLGYGCTEQGDADGILRFGFSKLSRRPSSLQHPAAEHIFAKRDKSMGDALLCGGDSGGPVYASLSGTFGDRRIIAVNTGVLGSTSIFSATASDAGAKFIRDWAIRHNQVICGVNEHRICR